MDFKYIVESRDITKEEWEFERIFKCIEECREYVNNELRKYIGYDYRIIKIYSDGECFYDR